MILKNTVDVIIKEDIFYVTRRQVFWYVWCLWVLAPMGEIVRK